MGPHEQAVARDRTGPLSRGVIPGFIRGPNPWRSRAPLSARRLTWLQETPPRLLGRRRHATAPPPRPCTGEHGHAHHTGPGQRGHSWGQPARSQLSPIPEQFPSSSGRSPRRRLHARIRSPTGRLEPRVSGRAEPCLDPTEGSVHRVPEKFPVLAVKVRALACVCAGEDVRPPNSTRAACWHPGWPRARPPRRRPLRVTTLARSRARRVLRGRRPVRTGRPPLSPSPATGLLVSTPSGARRSQAWCLSPPGPRPGETPRLLYASGGLSPSNPRHKALSERGVGRD
jgi:hypothetical protein